MRKPLVLLLATCLAASAALAAEDKQAGGLIRNNLNPQPLPPVAPTPGDNPRLQRSGLNPQPLPPLESGRLNSIVTNTHAAGGAPAVAVPAGPVPHPEGTGPRQKPVAAPGGQMLARPGQSPAIAADRNATGRSALSGVLESGSGSGK